MPVGAVGNAFCAFSKERWTRFVRPWLRQLPWAWRRKLFTHVLAESVTHVVASYT
jgi:hypothetical protein